MEGMEEGELLENEEKLESFEKKIGGTKRTQSMVEEEDIDEALDIKPPPVANKKHKRHHKKHKTPKEEKRKKKNLSRSPERDRDIRNREKTSRIEDIADRRSADLSDRHGPRKDGRSIERMSRLDPKYSSHERSKSYEYKSHERSGRSYPAKRESDGKRDRYISHHPDDPDKDRASYTKARDEKHGYSSSSSYTLKPDDARNRIERRREESKSTRGPLLVRKYDDDKRNERLSARSKHDRSASDYVTTSGRSSATSGLSHSRRSDSDLHKAQKRGHGNDSASRPRSRGIEEKPMTGQNPKDRKVIVDAEKGTDIAEEVESSEDTSGDSSENSESESSDEEEEEETGSMENDGQAKVAAKEGKDEIEASSEESSSSLDEEAEDNEEEDEEEEMSGEEVSDEEGSQTGSNQEETSDESETDGEPRSKFDSPKIKEKSESEAELEEPEDAEEVEVLPSPEPEPEEENEEEESSLPFYYPAIQGCRSVDEFTCLNRIEEGTYGVVYRAKDKTKGTVVALKRLKMEKEREGFPITSLREVSTLLKAHHPNIVKVQEIVVGSNVDKIYIVMEYVEHDLKSLMETMKQPFLVGEVKTLMIQLLSGVHHLHDNWILHRDLKTSNLLLSHKGILKIGDFGLAREYGSPLKPYTPIVVTLWYRSPELLLGVKEYSCAVDMWSVGCIFAELLSMKPLFPGKSEIMQLNLIFKELGTPSEKIWPGYGELPLVKKTTFTNHPYNTLRKRFGATDLSDMGFDLLNRFLTYCPERRISGIKALEHDWFVETPKPVEPSMFPTWPAKSEQTKQKKAATAGSKTPKAPEGGMGYNKLLNEEEKLGFQLTAPKHGISKHGTGFSLRF